MKSFLHQAAEYIYNKYPENISQICVVLPTRRASIYFKNAPAQVATEGIWSPEVFFGGLYLLAGAGSGKHFLTFLNNMEMKTLVLNIQIPDSLDLDDREAAMLLATKLYEQGKLSLGQAAELAGYSKSTFMELLSRYKVPIFDYDPNELANDIKNAGNYHIRH